MSAAAPAWLAQRGLLYALLNGVFTLIVVTASMAGPAASPRSLYLCLLMALSSMPLLWLREINGRYSLLCAFFVAYLFFYGSADLVSLFNGIPASTSQGVISSAELGVLLGGAMAILGYRLALAQRAQRLPTDAPRDWPMSLIVAAGLATWVLGTGAVWIWQVQLQTSATSMSKDFSDSALLALVFARMLQPLGTIMLAYALIATRSRPLLLLIVGLMCVQVFVGFVGDSKETAMRGMIILVMAGLLIQGRVKKGWFLGIVLFAVVAFPVFQGYRAEVMHQRGMSRAAAAADFLTSLKRAWQAKDKVNDRSTYTEAYAAPSFIERSALKPTFERFVQETGGKVEYQNGYTMWLFFTGFVPRMIWPDKPDSSVGQLVNHEFHVSDDEKTYISSTHLGELYWNFGWPGVVLGMLALGFLLGFINARCDLSERATLTRLLILITTIYATIVRFEGSIALEYIVFVRSLVIIGVLHLLFARVPVPVKEGEAEVPGPRAPLIRAPQLMR